MARTLQGRARHDEAIRAVLGWGRGARAAATLGLEFIDADPEKDPRATATARVIELARARSAPQEPEDDHG